MSKASLELGGGNWGTKDGNLLAYAQGNESSNLVPREFTFTRGSDIAATRINSSGSIEKYRENLLLQSNQFYTTWSDELLGSIVSGQSGYDGTNDAWLLNKGEYQYRRILQTLSPSVSGIWTLSVYAKEGTTSIMNLRDMTNAYRVEFDLSGSGSVSAAFGNISSKIESVGNGWFRCSATFNSTSSSIGIYVGWNDSTASNIYIQDAQLEQGLVATSYLESGATTATSGVADNEPRIDYASGTASLLLEPSRTNEFSFSEYASGNTLTGSPIITENYAVSPDGMSNAFRIQDTTGGTFKRIAESFSVSANSTYTQSIFVKKATSAVSIYGGIGFDYSGGTREISYIIFDEYNGTMTAIQSQSTLTLHDAEDYGDYWRFSITATDTGSNNYLSLNIYACLSTNGTSPTAGVKDWIGYGLQLEEGSYPTSYIPNHSGGSVTRSADYVNKTGLGSSVFNNDNLTLFLDFDYNAEGREGSTTKYRIFSDSSQLGIKGTSSTTRALQVLASGDFSGTINFNSANASRIKVALRITNGTCELFFNGVKDTETIDVSAAAPYNWDRIAILLDNSMNSSLNQCLGFPTALTYRELVDLTSPYSTYQELVTAEGLTWESPTCTTNSITELQSI